MRQDESLLRRLEVTLSRMSRSARARAVLAALALAGCGTEKRSGEGTEGRGAPSIAVVGSAAKARPDGAIAGAAGAVLVAARNEFESFQIVVNAGEEKALRDVTVSLEERLVGPDPRRLRRLRVPRVPGRPRPRGGREPDREGAVPSPVRHDAHGRGAPGDAPRARGARRGPHRRAGVVTCSSPRGPRLHPGQEALRDLAQRCSETTAMSEFTCAGCGPLGRRPLGAVACLGSPRNRTGDGSAASTGRSPRPRLASAGRGLPEGATAP